MITLADIISVWLIKTIPNDARINVHWHVAAGFGAERYLRLEPPLAAPMGRMYANYKIYDDYIFMYNAKLMVCDPLFFEKIVDQMEKVVDIWKTPVRPAKKGKSRNIPWSWETSTAHMAGPYFGEK
jgi:hypothetical protein